MRAAAFETWYRSEHPSLVRSLTVVAGDVDLAGAIVAEACARLWERWDADVIANPSAWAYRVAVNLLRRRLRRGELEHTVLRRQAAAAPAPVEVNPEFWEALRRLPLRQREAIALRYVADLTEREVAAAMQVAPGTASAALTAARRALASSLEHLNKETSVDEHP